jgi:type IV pilus assembly protein PilA
MNATISIARPRRMRRPVRTVGSALANGFTLMELLIVIAIILILMLMAIPTVGTMTRYANETSAKKSMQTIAQAELEFQSTFPTNGFACSLAALGGDPNSGAPSATGAQILQQDLASGIKSGYQFTISNCQKVTANGVDRYTTYQVTATPLTVNKTGDRGYCMDQSAVIKLDPAGGTNCTQTVQ